MHSGGDGEPLEHFRGEGLRSDLNSRTPTPAATGTEDEATLQAVVPREVAWQWRAKEEEEGLEAALGESVDKTRTAWMWSGATISEAWRRSHFPGNDN